MPTNIEYNGSIVTTIPDGSTAILPLKDKKMVTDVTIVVDDLEVYDGTGIVTALIIDLIMTIGTTTYSILPQMTWYEWVNSEYNTGGFTCGANDDTIFDSEGNKCVADSDGNIVYGSDLIIMGSAYKTQYPASLFNSEGAQIVDASGAILTLKE